MEHTAVTLNEICVAIFVAVAASDYDKQLKKGPFSVRLKFFQCIFIVECLLFLAQRPEELLQMSDVPIKHT